MAELSLDALLHMEPAFARAAFCNPVVHQCLSLHLTGELPLSHALAIAIGQMEKRYGFMMAENRRLTLMVPFEGNFAEPKQ